MGVGISFWFRVMYGMFWGVYTVRFRVVMCNFLVTRPGFWCDDFPDLFCAISVVLMGWFGVVTVDLCYILLAMGSPIR